MYSLYKDYVFSYYNAFHYCISAIISQWLRETVKYDKI